MDVMRKCYMNEIRAARQLPEDPDLRLRDFIARTALYLNPRFAHVDPAFAMMQITPRWHRIFRHMLRNRRTLERNGSVQPRYEPYRTRLTVCALKFRRRKKGKMLQCSIYIGRHEVLSYMVRKTLKYWRLCRMHREERMRQHGSHSANPNA